VAGGPILVPMGLLAGAENEAEFAFQLSHAVAHIALRHGTRQATRLEISGIGSMALKNATGPTVEAMRSGVEQSRQSNAISMARLAEAEADAAAVGVLAAAGYDPRAAVRYLERLPAPDNAPRLESREGRDRKAAGAHLFCGLPASSRQ
jgi:predicted Zn-dependent protease